MVSVIVGRTACVGRDGGKGGRWRTRILLGMLRMSEAIGSHGRLKDPMWPGKEKGMVKEGGLGRNDGIIGVRKFIVGMCAFVARLIIAVGSFAVIMDVYTGNHEVARIGRERCKVGCAR